MAAATVEADGNLTGRTAPRRLVGTVALLATAWQEVMSKRSEPAVSRWFAASCRAGLTKA